ncbi:hypothetical protein [Hydrogenophaga sp.]|uniref:hypothetical protein n=1 Tax=Hydrogenophaga sp. TaxID=1904254 RepID=UPI003D116AA2
MSDALLAAIIAGSVAISVALLTQFAAEAYRRHREGSSVAAALAGELAAYSPAINTLSEELGRWLKTVAAGDREFLVIRTIERPTDVVFPEMVEKLGLLGVVLVEKVVFVYGQIHAFRVGHELISQHHLTMDDDELMGRLTSCVFALMAAHEEGEQLINLLKARAQRRFVPGSRSFWWTVCPLLVVGSALLVYR